VLPKRKAICASTANNRSREKKLSENVNIQVREYKAHERIFSAISAGAFFILIGIIYVIHLPISLWDKLIDFFGNFTLAQVPATGIYLPAPIAPNSHAVLYGAVFQFCIGIGILQIIMLVLRYMWQSPIGRTAETMGNLVFWFGTAYLVTAYLNITTDISKWFVFWAGLLMILGLSFIARAFVLLGKKWLSR
jgi:hypothetical protein